MVVAVLVLRENTGLLTSPRSAAEKKAPAPAETVSADANQMVIRAGRGGHFLVEASIGTRDIEFMVDTGASMVTLSQSDAETLGYYVHQLDYSGRAHTANGVARFARITIDEIAIGDMVVNDVPAAVMEKPMRQSLLGMTFLRKLAGFEVKGDRLFLRW